MSGRPPPRPRYGQWLQQQRRARSWSVPELRRRLREAARQAGDNLPDNSSLTVMIYRWEDDRSGISERYRLYYCRALGIPFAAFGKTPSEDQPEPPEPPAVTLLTLGDEAVSALTAFVASLRTAIRQGHL